MLIDALKLLYFFLTVNSMVLLIQHTEEEESRIITILRFLVWPLFLVGTIFFLGRGLYL